MSGDLTCSSDMGSAATIANSSRNSFADFKNPFTPSAADGATVASGANDDKRLHNNGMQIVMTMQL